MSCHNPRIQLQHQQIKQHLLKLKLISSLIALKSQPRTAPIASPEKTKLNAKYLLKPSFNTAEPLNYLAIFLAGFLGFAIPYPAHAYEDDGTYRAGTYYVLYRGTCPSATKSGVAACMDGLVGGSRAYFVEGSGTHLGFTNTTNGSVVHNSDVIYTNPCNSSVTGYCAPPEPVNDCPEAGETIRLSKVVNGHYDENGTFVPGPTPTAGQPAIDIKYGDSFSADGCGYRNPTPDDFSNGFDFNTSCKKSSDGAMICSTDYISTGELQTPKPEQPPVTQSEGFIEDKDLSDDTRVDHVEVVDPPPVNVIDSSGASITTDQKTTTETRGDGAVVTKEQDTHFISESDGIVKNEVVTTTTYEYPDGSKTVQTESQITYTQSETTNWTVSGDGNTVSITASDGSTAGTHTVTTDTYDSDGNKTGSTSTTTNSGEGDSEAGDERGKDKCKKDPNAKGCDKEKKYSGPTEQGLFTPNAELTYEAVIGRFQSGMSSAPIVGASTGFFDLNLSSGSCPTWNASIPVFNGSIDVEIDHFCDPFARDLLGYAKVVVLIIASFLAFRVAIL